MAKFSVGRLEEEGEGPSSRSQKRQRRESEPQTAVIEGITDEELEATVDYLEATVDYLVEEENGEGNNQEFEQHGSAANNRDRTDVVGPSRNGSISVTDRSRGSRLLHLL